MKNNRLLTIQDISCLGKCSLTVALPIISSIGVECCVIPTAVLSTHTGGFENYTFKDLTGELEPIVRHWDSYNINFDAIYSGYIANAEQLCIIKGIFEHYKQKGSIAIVDPVLGDNGKLYKGFDSNFAEKMRKLCTVADIVIPNVTEASIMLGIPYEKDCELNQEKTESLLHKLSDINDKCIILTGVNFEKESIGAAIFDVKNDKIEYCFARKIGENFHGSGDIFASVLSGCIVKGYSVKDACQVAVDFVSKCIENTLSGGNSRSYCVNFEESLGLLTELNEQKG